MGDDTVFVNQQFVFEKSVSVATHGDVMVPIETFPADGMNTYVDRHRRY